MEKVFGIELTRILITVLSLSITATVVLFFLGITHKVLVKMGIRNIPRRPAQSVLIILGLMLSTTIIGASLGIGDTVSHSIRKAALDSMGFIDETVRARSSSPFNPGVLEISTLDLIRELADKNPDIDGVIASMETVAPTLNTTNDRTESRLVYRGYEQDQQPSFGTLLDIDGNVQLLSELEPNKVFLNQDAAEKLAAVTGDQLNMFTSSGTNYLSVQSVLQPGGLAGGGGNPVALLSLHTLQLLLDREAEVDQIGISNQGGIEDGLDFSDSVTGSLRVSLTDRNIANEIARLLDEEQTLALLRKKANEVGLNETLAKDLDTLVMELSSHDMATNETIRLIGDSDLYAVIVQALADIDNGDLVTKLDGKRRISSQFIVDDTKKDAIELAQTIGGTVTSIFTIFGSFSVVVGLLLIFLVMVLLAAARSAEMGMARAIGLRRMHLIQVFTYEGWVYAIGSAIMGTAVGVLASLILVSLLQRAIGVEEFAIYPKMTLRSIAITISTGFILTLATVTASAYRVSHLNIISAIRGVGEEFAQVPRIGWKHRLLLIGLALLGPIGPVIEGRKHQSRSHILLRALICCLPPVWIGMIVWRLVQAIYPLLGQGWPLMTTSVLICSYALQQDNGVTFDFGITLGILGAAFALRQVLNFIKPDSNSNPRISASLGSLGLLVYFGLPFDALYNLTGELQGGPEEFVLGGCIMVAAASWLVMHNAELFLFVLNKSVGKVGRINAVLRTAVAYPVNSRFRTGLTISMFALVIFTLVINATLSNLNNVARDNPDRVTGGYNIVATVTDDREIEDFLDEVTASPLVKSEDIETVARSSSFRTRLRQVNALSTRFKGIRTIVVDDDYLSSNMFELSHYDPSYGAQDTEVWQSLQGTGNFVLLSNSALVTDDPWGPPSTGFRVEGFSASDPTETWKTMDLEVVPSWNEEMTPVNVRAVGIIDPIATVGGGGEWGQSLFMVMGESTAALLIDGAPKWNTYYIRAKSTIDIPDLVAKFETIFLFNGMNATDLMEDIQKSLEQEGAFNQLFQGFMGLGLFVGVCAIGVLAIRAVVERRQSIGVLRAIGYRPAMIQLQFLLESLFVTLLGVFLGISLGALTSWNIFNAITKEVDGLTFAVPWTSIIVITLMTSLFALLSGYWPARQASKIQPAEALRYE